MNRAGAFCRRRAGSGFAIPGLVVVAGDETALVSWTGSASEPVQQLQRSLTGSGGWSNIAVAQSGAGGKQITDIGLVNGTPYFYRIVDGGGAAISPTRIAIPVGVTLADVAVAATVGAIAAFKVLPGAAGGTPPYSIVQPA